MFKLTKLTKAVTEALNAVPNVDELAKSMGAMEVDPRVVSEHGGVHSATCLAYEPTQRILAVGVDTGVKIICADGAEALLATPTHVEPARSVEFIAGVGRIVRLSSESGIDVLDLHSQRCLASTRWMKDATCVVGLRDSPFVMVGESTGCVRVAAVQHGPDGAGTLAPRSYKVTHAAAFGRIDSSESTSNAPAVVAIKPQPGAESTNILIAYEDGSMSLWDLHARRPAATTRVKLCGIFAESGGGCVQWLGASGRSVVVAHDDGRLVTYGVPTVYPKAPVLAIVVTSQCFPGGSEGGGNCTMDGNAELTEEDGPAPAFEPLRRICAVASGRFVSPVRSDGGASVQGAVLCVGGEVVGAGMDPARAVPFKVSESGGESAGLNPSLVRTAVSAPSAPGSAPSFAPVGPDASPMHSLPWFGPVLDGVLITRVGRPECVTAACVLSEGGQIHVHDLRSLGCNPVGGDAIPGSVSIDERSEHYDAAAAAAVAAVVVSAAKLPCAEVLDPLPGLSGTCAPACAVASPHLSLRRKSSTNSGLNIDSGLHRAHADRDAWGHEWPITGGHVDDAGAKWATRRERLMHLLAIPSGSDWKIRVFSDELKPGRLVELCDPLAPGPNAGTTAADRAVTRCHVACGGSLLVVGRACGSVEVHVAALESSGGNTQKNKERSPFESGEQKGLIRQLDSGLDLASAGGGGSHPPGDESGTESRGYQLVGELGVHVAAVTSIVTDATCSLLCVGDASGVVSLTDLTNGLMLTNTRVFTGDGEGVGSMTLCPPILGTGPKIDKNLDHTEGSGTIGGDTEEGEEGKGVGEEAETSREVDKPPAGNVPPSRFPGAEVLCVASTKSAVVFLDTALGKCHKTTSPKTPSLALAVAPLTVSGTVAASVMTGGADDALHARVHHSRLWFNSEDAAEDETARGGATQTDASATHVAFVGVASATALRVYPAFGVLKGERHTVKKTTPDEPLVAAALVVPRAADDDDDDDDDDVSSGSQSARSPPSWPAAFVAVSSHGRLLTWSLPGLTPTRSIGPVPPLSAMDAAGFCVDGAVFAIAGGGVSVAKLAIAPRSSRGAKAKPESGLVLYDHELAAAAAAAESAAKSASRTSHAASDQDASTRELVTGNAPSPFSPEGTPEKQRKGDPPGNRTQGTNNDLSKSVNHFLKGDGRAAMASFGSVMRRTKEKAAVAMVQAKEKIKTRMSASGAGDGSYPGDESGTYEKGPMDLAFLFAEPECLETPDAPEIVPEREVAKVAPRLNAAAGSNLVRGTSGSSGKSSNEDDADRAALFGSGGGGGGGSSSGVGSSSTTSYPTAPKLNTAADIRAKYGIGRKKADEADGMTSSLEATRDKLAERGERLKGIQDKTERMQSDADDFASMAEKLRKQQEKSWW